MNSFASFASFAVTLFVFAFAAPPATAAAPACLSPATWHVLREGAPQPARAQDVLADMARRDVVLLGEHHDNANHHRWQLQTLAALHLLRPQMAIGFEAFPRRVQPVLDQWVAGQLSAKQFLEHAEWEKVWNLPAELYMPLFEFARINHITMVALNVERTLTAEIREKGWDAVPAARKEGLARPAAASPAYEKDLFDVFRQHAAAGKTSRRDDPAFIFFLQSQTTWDRAMAEAIAAQLKGAAGSRPLVVGVMGAGHIRHGHGVTHQLRDLGIASVGALLPSEARADCRELTAGLADAIFALPAAPEDPAPPARLGVQLEMADGAVRVAGVQPGSLAEQSGIRAGDRIVSVAGIPPKAVGSVIAAVRGAPPGTWLPLEVRRGEKSIELVVKFPPRS